ncbi:hypothetical protein F53441_5329 [Fusarium austroafricanum]|uniref:Carboxylesterase type B domain-containing protein n=1 Tax=Fusarium austroafricanum TaxID=2364996 RepID=A0A8H4NXQ9_9HYPO|nr:hypothetical protein F53441_5329 [Fusarium austroafricanum]
MLLFSHLGPSEDSIHASHTGTSAGHGTPNTRSRREPGQTEPDLLYLNILQDTVNDTSAAHTDASDHETNDGPDDSFNTQIHHWNPPPQLDDIDNEYLIKKKLFELPPPRYMDAIVRAYFDYVHPYAPILNRTDFVQSYRSGTYSPFLMYAMSTAACLYVPSEVILGCGYADRAGAQTDFFSKAKLFHDFYVQGDQLSMLQGSTILSATILDHPSDKDFQYWFYNSVRRASKLGIHNACLRDGKSQKLYRRIWWVLHVGLHSHLFYTAANMLKNGDIFHAFVNTQNMRLLANAPPIKPPTEDDWELEDIDQGPGLLSPITQAQKFSFIAHCELAQIFGDIMSASTSSSASVDDVHKLIHQLDLWRVSLSEKMQPATSFTEGEFYHLQALTTSYRFECIMCRLLRRGRWQIRDGELREWAQQRFRSAIGELDNIVKRVMINNAMQKLPITFITTITALLALHVESALDSSESALIRSMARISIQHTMLALDQIRDIPAIKRALPAFESVLSKNKLYPCCLVDKRFLMATYLEHTDRAYFPALLLPAALPQLLSTNTPDKPWVIDKDLSGTYGGIMPITTHKMTSNMKYLQSLTAVVLAICAVGEARGLHYSSESPLTIKTTSGHLSGFINETAPDVRQFLGVPYAEPPLKSRRFQPPHRKHSTAHISAKKYAPSCKQIISKSPTVYTEHMTQFLINGGDSEDCLYLNVYAPLKPTSKRLPVFIYIPGGGFTGGGADSLYKIPDKWIQKTQSHIVVTMNYRVNLFGFPNAESAHQNVGLLDQRMVVEWARDNIGAFGGDPQQMILWGQSAGAGSVGMYGYAYPKDLIVKGLISDSGAPGMLVKPYGNYSSFDTLASKVGCAHLKGRKQLSCMQMLDASLLQKVYSETSSISFTPVGDNVTAFSNTTDRLSRGLVTKVPWIFGNNANEGAGFGTYNASGLSPSQTAIGLQAITCPVAAEVRDRAKFGYSTYRYYYTGNFSNISPLPWIGATHSAELPLLFGTHYEYRGNSTAYEWEVAEGMQSLWLSFAENPQKAPKAMNGITWPLYKPEQRKMAVIAEANAKWFQLRDESLTENQCKTT